MRTFKIVVALLFAAASIGVTGAIYLQSEGAAIAVGLLLALVIVSFLIDYRKSIFRGGAPRGKSFTDKAGVAVAQGTALTRFAEGEVRGAPNFRNS